MRSVELQVTPFVMVIFGATGDLIQRKLMPALFQLFKKGILPKRFFIVGVARRNFTHDQFREMMKEAVIKNKKTINNKQKTWEQFARNLYYNQGFFEDGKLYKRLIPLLSSFDKEMGACITRFFYLATPPQNYSTILENLEISKLAEGCGQGSSKWTRVLIEKPFGRDLNQAKRLEEQLATTFEERQIYRIDHYLAKETIQNILAFRFANPLEALWHKDFIEHIQITLAESGGVGKRGKFYEGVGALKDVAQNHLMAILAYITMEEPSSLTAAEIRKKRVEVLEKLRCHNRETVISGQVIRGQFGEGMIGGRSIVGYRSERDIDPESNTETFVALKLFIDNDRWRDVPFYLRTGKRMPQNVTRIDIQLKNRDSHLFRQFHLSSKLTNAISIRVQPQEGISFRFFAKSPGYTFELQPVDMDFSYSKSFKLNIVDSYEKLLMDSMVGDQTLFATAQGFEATWRFITSITDVWEKMPPPKFPNYPAGSWGPKEAIELIERDGRRWNI